MPIKYNKEKNGFEIIDASPEEMNAIINMGLASIMGSLAKDVLRNLPQDSVPTDGESYH